MKKLTPKAIKTTRVKTIKENDTGRNLRFQDIKTKKEMTDKGFVRAIKKGKYVGYHIRTINGIETPVSNPNGNECDNLG